MGQLYEKVRTFIYRNARPLDLARFRYHFESGSREEVLTILSFYQNIDGSFGYGLETDTPNLDSAPAQVYKAIKILEEIDFHEINHPIMKGILNFLENGKCFDGHFWYTGLKSNHDYNPTAALAGFAVRFADKESKLYETGRRIVKEAYESLVFDNWKDDVNTVCCYIQMLDYLKDAKETDIVDLIVLEVRLRDIVKRTITQDKEKWNGGCTCRPSQYFNSRDSIFYKDNKEIADYECKFIYDKFIYGTQLTDCPYRIPGIQVGHSEKWAVSKIWQKSEINITNLLYLKNMVKNYPLIDY